MRLSHVGSVAAVVVLLAAPVALAPALAQDHGERVLRGDLNCDSAVDFGDINPFVLALSDGAAWQALYPGCPLLNGDINLDGAVDFADINPFVALLAGAHLGEVSHTDCWEDVGGRDWCPPDVIQLTVEGSVLHTHHQDAEYNCCFEDIAVTLTVEGNLIRLDEEEIVPDPCWCLCCVDVWATVAGLASGNYTVEYCWFEYGTNQVECYSEDIVIP